MKEVLQSTETAARQSRHVRIDKKNLDRFAAQLAERQIRIPPWNCHYHFCEHSTKAVAYLLVLDTLNFCFWPAPGEQRWETEWESETVSGYFGLAAALKRALLAQVPVTDPHFLADMTLETLNKILGGRGTLPLMEKRVENLNELGSLLVSQYSGRAEHLVEAADQSAPSLARLLARQLPSFRDIAEYERQTVYFYKRAQIFASDLYGAFQGKEWGELRDVDKLTAFADYKLPQVLRHMGILEYSPPLAERIDRLMLLEPGSPEEVEIRANTICAVEQIRHALKKRGQKISASEIDWLLWTMGQEGAYRAKPYHRTRTIFY